MSVVAEGIEHPEQAELLRAMRSPLGQGFLFSRPVTREQLHALLDADRPLTSVSATEFAGLPANR
jgi:EAL domain-containing protein (putative c-di-GMP-specific phosphodiesterase class I)